MVSVDQVRWYTSYSKQAYPPVYSREGLGHGQQIPTALNTVILTTNSGTLHKLEQMESSLLLVHKALVSIRCKPSPPELKAGRQPGRKHQFKVSYGQTSTMYLVVQILLNIKLSCKRSLHLIFTITQEINRFYGLHFIHEETEGLGGDEFLLSARACIQGPDWLTN